MSVLVLNVFPEDKYWEQIVQLEGIEYVLRFLWSERESCWYMGVYDQDDTQLAVGVKLVISWPLLHRFQDAELPPGRLFCVDMTGLSQDIQIPSDLGSRVLLMYITSDDGLLVPVA